MGTNDGVVPEGSLVFDAVGNLYGTTTLGPDSGPWCGLGTGCGTIFQLTPPVGAGPWVENTLYIFNGPNGANPHGGLLIDPSGNFFSTTLNGGPNGGQQKDGVAFELVPPQSGGSWTEAVLYNFVGGGDAHPNGFVEDSSGNLYGTTQGNAENVCGEIFKLSNSASGWNRTVLHSFTDTRFSEGCVPQAPLVYGKWNALYGTTSQGGDRSCGCGTVFGFLP
jgi:uncharacterized repeat protein (TIGR03803 family)